MNGHSPGSPGLLFGRAVRLPLSIGFSQACCDFLPLDLRFLYLFDGLTSVRLPMRINGRFTFSISRECTIVEHVPDHDRFPRGPADRLAMAIESHWGRSTLDDSPNRQVRIWETWRAEKGGCAVGIGTIHTHKFHGISNGHQTNELLHISWEIRSRASNRKAMPDSIPRISLHNVQLNV
jgi:hypothetical protein